MPQATDDSNPTETLSYAEAQTPLPTYLVELKESLFVDLCKLKVKVEEITRKTRWTQEEAADIAGCSVKTIKKAVKQGLLATGRSGWITRPELAQWLGFDPVEETILRVRMLEKQIRQITDDIDRRLQARESMLEEAIRTEVNNTAA